LPSWRRAAQRTRRRSGSNGTLPAAIARQLAASDFAWARRLVCDPADGSLVSMDTKRRRFEGALRKFTIYRDGVLRGPYSDTPIYDTDHITRHADGGPTTAANAEGLGLSDHHILDLPGWTVAAVNGDAAEGVRWTTPTEHTYSSKPPPILGHGNLRRRRPLIEVYAHPINAEYAVTHRRSDE
jgi:hypothetical protein